MATMTVIQPVYIGQIRPGPARFAGGPEYPHFKETASQTFGVGDLVYLDSNGTIAICTSSGNILNSRVAGQATKKATGTTGEGVHFRAITESDLFLMSVYHTTAASAVTAQTQLGTKRQIKLISGIWRVDIENTVEGATDANAHVSIVDFALRHPDGTKCAIGDVNGLVIVHFNNVSLASDAQPLQGRLLQMA